MDTSCTTTSWLVLAVSHYFLSVQKSASYEFLSCLLKSLYAPYIVNSINDSVIMTAP